MEEVRPTDTTTDPMETQFNEIIRAVKHGHLAVMDCKRKSDNKTIPVLVSIRNTPVGIAVVPLALMFENPPLDDLHDPMTSSDMIDSEIRQALN